MARAVLGREVLDLGGDDGKALSGFTGTRSLNGCVQREQVAGEKAQADITMVSMTIGDNANQSMMTLLKLVSTQVPVSQGFADLVGFVNLASILLDRASVAPDVDSVAALEKNFKAMSARVEEKVDIVDTLQPTDGLRKATEAVDCILVQGDIGFP